MKKINYKLSSVKKFYLLEYFYVLLKSIERKLFFEEVFENFKILKQKFNLGESKYKKISESKKNLSPNQIIRFKYTFEQVIFEAKEYKLIDEKYSSPIIIDKIDSNLNRKFILTEKGINALNIYQKQGYFSFNKFLFNLMENKYNAFHYLISFCYQVNKKKNGLLILPNYSPLKLDIERSSIKRTKDIINYSLILQKQLEKDIKKHLYKEINLTEKRKELIIALIETELLPKGIDEFFKSKNYNAIINKFRRFWLSYFLNEIYKFEFSLPAFEIWVYRAKQIGLLHATEFFPDFSGKIIFPISIIRKHSKSSDFSLLKKYENNDGLYLHEPKWEKNKELFVDALLETYISLKSKVRSYFVNLLDMREIICYKLKISESLFDDYLGKAYKLNLAGKLKINISIEADRLPEETNAMYLKREPVLIDKNYKNIIAIDLAKRGRK